MLEKKNKGGAEDFIDIGSNIVAQLIGQKSVSVAKVEGIIQHLEVKFDQNAVKSINEICKCAFIEGAENFVEDKPILDDQSLNKFSNT